MEPHSENFGPMENSEHCSLEFNDGHKSRATDDPTRLVFNLRKESSRFVSVFDDLLDHDWCQRTYEYSLRKKKPWGEFDSQSESLLI